VKRFRGGLVFKAHRLVYHSTLGWRVIKKKKVYREDDTIVVFRSGCLVRRLRIRSRPDGKERKHAVIWTTANYWVGLLYW